MTTVAYRDGILASDMRLSRGDEPLDGFLKLRETADWAFGVAGEAWESEAILDWIERVWDLTGPALCHLRKRPYGTGEDSVVLLVEKATRFIWNVDPVTGGVLPINRKIEAIGSGSKYAIGAMAMGATAIQAVEIAAKFDTSTGGGVKAIYFDEMLAGV